MNRLLMLLLAVAIIAVISIAGHMLFDFRLPDPTTLLLMALASAWCADDARKGQP